MNNDPVLVRGSAKGASFEVREDEDGLYSVLLYSPNGCLAEFHGVTTWSSAYLQACDFLELFIG